MVTLPVPLGIAFGPSFQTFSIKSVSQLLSLVIELSSPSKGLFARPGIMNCGVCVVSDVACHGNFSYLLNNSFSGIDWWNFQTDGFSSRWCRMLVVAKCLSVWLKSVYGQCLSSKYCIEEKRKLKQPLISVKMTIREFSSVVK